MESIKKGRDNRKRQERERQAQLNEKQKSSTLCKEVRELVGQVLSVPQEGIKLEEGKDNWVRRTFHLTEPPKITLKTAVPLDSGDVDIKLVGFYKNGDKLPAKNETPQALLISFVEVYDYYYLSPDIDFRGEVPHAERTYDGWWKKPQKRNRVSSKEAEGIRKEIAVPLLAPLNPLDATVDPGILSQVRSLVDKLPAS